MQSVSAPNFVFEGSCNYAFNVVLREPDYVLRDQMRLCSLIRVSNSEEEAQEEGNQMRQPYLSENVCSGDWASYPEVEHIHFFGWYIGNYPDLKPERIADLCHLLNNA